jgi:mono/diheme cytochrome c family protein
MQSSYKAGLIGAAALLIAVLLVAAGVAVSGVYNVAADEPHFGLTRDVIGYVRDRAVAMRSAGIAVPKLSDPGMIADGASDYDEMCTSCHLAPGLAENEMRPGLNPKPPVLASLPPGNAAEQFWIVKHGIKMSGMPTWGVTHSDAEIWNIVAFLQKLPSLSPAQYRAAVASAASHHDHDHMDMEH